MKMRSSICFPKSNDLITEVNNPKKANVTTRVEFGAVTPRVPWFGGTGLVSGAPQGWFKLRLRPKDSA